MKVFYHRNTWCWGRQTIIISQNGACTVMVSLEYGDDIAYISDMSVVEEERRNGYAKNILKRAEEEAKKMGAKFVELWSIEKSFTTEWYKREGYIICQWDESSDLNDPNNEYIKMIKEL